MNINEFFKESINLIDSQDLEREFKNSEVKYATKIAQKELEINNLNSQINNIVNKTKEINNNTKSLKSKLKLINESLQV